MVESLERVRLVESNCARLRVHRPSEQPMRDRCMRVAQLCSVEGLRRLIVGLSASFPATPRHAADTGLRAHSRSWGSPRVASRANGHGAAQSSSSLSHLDSSCYEPERSSKWLGSRPSQRRSSRTKLLAHCGRRARKRWMPKATQRSRIVIEAPRNGGSQGGMMRG